MSLLKHKDSGQLLAVVPPISLQSFESQAPNDRHHNVDYFRWNQRQIEDDDLALRPLIAADVVAEPAGKRIIGRGLRCSDAGQRLPPQQPVNSEPE